ncbi:MAG: site-2 protease family protein [Sandaracinus sp.]|nr:site-2 protease family protein [Sandaracinus sp.]
MSLGPLDYLLIIVGISILVIVHESGHYFAARAFKMRVLRYSIGFGPTLFKYQPKGSPTVFQVAAIPFLAYVQIAGMNPHEDVDPKDPELFGNKSVFARVVTIAAGPVANYVCAALIVFAISLTGWPQSWLGSLFPDDPRAQMQPTEPVVGVVLAGVAQDAGIQVGDRFVEAQGQPVDDFSDLIAVTAPRPGQETTYVVERNGERLTFTLTPRRDGEVGRIGLGPVPRDPVYVQLSVGEAAQMAMRVPWRLTVMQLEGMARMARELRTDEVGGPVAMGKMIGDAAQRGPTDYFFVLALLSTALGLFNLLPLPALDGGRLAFLGFELITRRRPNEKLEAIVHTVGIVFLLCVLVLVTFRDVFGKSPEERAAEAAASTSEPAEATPEPAAPAVTPTPTTHEGANEDTNDGAGANPAAEAPAPAE